jgi:hypothetical protein
MRNNSEGNVYKVLWEKLASGYSAWLSRVPKLKVTGKDEEELSDKLFEITMDRFGDGEPCFDFNPPLPVKTERRNYFDPVWFTLGCNEGFRTVGDRSKLYSEGLCSYCGAGRGKRTSATRIIDGVPKSDMAILWGELRRVYIVSDRFTNFFGPLLGRRIRKVACSPIGKTKKVFYELELTPELPLVVHKKATSIMGVACPSCKEAYGGSFVCISVAKGIFCAVELEQLLRLKRKATVAGNMRGEICVNALVAKQLKTKSGLKGVLLERLMLLKQKDIGKCKLAKADKVQR